MIPNGEGWHYIAVRKLSVLLKGITSKHGDFCCLNGLHSFRTKHKLVSNKKVCENKYFYNIVMPCKESKIVEFNLYQKFDKGTFIIYANFECLIEKIEGCKNNPENPSTIKVEKHISSGFSISTTSFKRIEKKTLCMQKRLHGKVL